MSDEDGRLLTARVEKALIKRAKEGDAAAGKDLLAQIMIRIDAKSYDSDLFPYLADCLCDFVYHDIPLDRALNVEEEKSTGGRPSYDHKALAAVDILLGRYAKYGSDRALVWIKDNIGADKRTMRRIRKTHQADYKDQRLTQALLLVSSGKYLQKVAQVLPYKEIDIPYK